MLAEAHQRRLIAERCWEVYDLIPSTFALPSEFHVEFPELAKRVLDTGLLQLRVQIDANHFLHVEEEYDFRNHESIVEKYSYVLLDKDRDVVIRADPLPYHQVDYKKHRLKNFPHHLHDEKGRICSFTGRIEDFVIEIMTRLAT